MDWENIKTTNAIKTVKTNMKLTHVNENSPAKKKAISYLQGASTTNVKRKRAPDKESRTSPASIQRIFIDKNKKTVKIACQNFACE